MNKKLEWVKDHKKEIIIGTATIVGTAICIHCGIKYSKRRKEEREFNDALIGTLEAIADDYKKKASREKLTEILCGSTEVIGTAKDVDEDIFTKLAPAIEEAVIDNGLEKIFVERSYNMPDNLAKLVTVTVENK